MPSCEKCWSDAFTRSRTDTSKCQAEHYQDLINERKDNPCTPEEQAGMDAKICPKCKRRAIHQIIDICMNCGFNNKQDEPL